ncbi:DUF309 domain-containing protein [Halorubrum sp. SY-15]|uniref:DUF309 domain-containing protein n=1 Tax=Halorubrum sp. SY-15 TaxID=3402277 RepID=UPI003EBE0DDB
MHDASDGPPAVNPALCAGVALFNEGYHLAAHEPWEAAWLPLETGDDERLLHGLIAATAATHHATDRNWSGAAGCAANAVDYLTAVSPGHRDVSLEPVVEWCHRLRVDPETIERVGPPRIRVDEAATGFTDLDVHAALLAAPGLASTVDTGDAATLETAATLAIEERGTGRTQVIDLVFSYLTHPERRPQIAARIDDHVGRANRKRRDVDGLFE